MLIFLMILNSPGVAWYAHIGGFLIGLFLVPFLKKRNLNFFLQEPIKEKSLKE